MLSKLFFYVVFTDKMKKANTFSNVWESWECTLNICSLLSFMTSEQRACISLIEFHYFLSWFNFLSWYEWQTSFIQWLKEWSTVNTEMNASIAISTCLTILRLIFKRATLTESCTVSWMITSVSWLCITIQSYNRHCWSKSSTSWRTSLSLLSSKLRLMLWLCRQRWIWLQKNVYRHWWQTNKSS